MDMKDPPDEKVKEEYSKQWIPAYGLIRSIYKGFKKEPSIMFDSFNSSKYGLFFAFPIYHGAVPALFCEAALTGLELLVDYFK